MSAYTMTFEVYYDARLLNSLTDVSMVIYMYGCMCDYKFIRLNMAIHICMIIGLCVYVGVCKAG